MGEQDALHLPHVDFPEEEIDLTYIFSGDYSFSIFFTALLCLPCGHLFHLFSSYSIYLAFCYPSVASVKKAGATFV